MLTTKFDDLTDEQRQEIIPQARPVDPGARLESIQDVRPGVFMWVLPSAQLFSDDAKGYLAKVAFTLPARNQVHVHVLNTRNKARRTGWELLWGDKGDWNKEKRTPVTDKYKPTFKPWIEVVEFENLVPTVVRVTGGDDSTTGKAKMYSIAPAFYEQYVRSSEPPSWLEHLQTLHGKESDPPPRKGVQARQRSEPAASKDRSQPSNKSRSKKNKAAPKRARPTLPRQAKIAAVNTTPGQRELLLIQSVQAVHSWASAHGYWRG